MRATVVTVHGWHMTGLEMLLLRRRLRHAGYEVRAFLLPTLLLRPHDGWSRCRRPRPPT